MLQGPKGRKSPVQMSFKNDFILETDTTAELKVGDSCLVYDTRQAMWTREAVVTEVRPSGRSYWLEEVSTGASSFALTATSAEGREPRLLTRLSARSRPRKSS